MSHSETTALDRWWFRPRTYGLIALVLTAFAIELLPRNLFWALVSPIRKAFDLGAGTVQGAHYIACLVFWFLFVVMLVVQIRRRRAESDRVLREWNEKQESESD